MEIEFRSNLTCDFDNEDGGSICNISDKFIINKVISKEELISLYECFASRLRVYFKKMLLMSQEDASKLNAKIRATLRPDSPYGLTTGKHGALVFFKKPSIVKAMLELGELEPRRYPRSSRHLPQYSNAYPLLFSLPAHRQRVIVEHIADTQEIDEYYNFGHIDKLDLQELEEEIRNSDDSEAFLRRLGGHLEDFIENQRASDSDTGRKFAPVWFSQFLAASDIWFFPLDYWALVHRMYPWRLTPVLVWMSLPEHSERIADRVLSFAMGRGFSEAPTLPLLVGIAQSSDMFSAEQFRPAPLISVKRHFQGKGTADATRGAACNKIYEILLAYHNITDWNSRKEAFIFSGRVRLKSAMHSGFNWCYKPDAKNTKLIQRCFDAPLTSVPRYVQIWAEEIDALTTLVPVENIYQITGPLSIWLAFLIHLGEDKAPKSFFEIDRHRHINSYNDDDDLTFRNFVPKYFGKEGKTNGAASLTRLAQFWVLASQRGGWASLKSCPVDPRADRLIKLKGKGARTTRQPMDQKAWTIIREENRKNFYEFAKSQPECTRRVLNPQTKLYDEVFWPIEAIIIDFILSTAARHKTARSLDSGEGDERVVDFETMSYVKNHLPCAEKGRRNGVLRLIDINDNGPKIVLGMFLNHNKTGKPYEVPFLEAELARALKYIISKVSFYDPLERSIELISDYSRSRKRTKVGQRVYPVFRVPGHPHKQIITATRTMEYWRKLCLKCEPLVDEALGYSYPLFYDGKLLFDIHSLRVTLVTVLFDKGVDVETIQQLVGHASQLMTWYYNGVRHSKNYNTLQQAFASIHEVADGALSGDENAIRALVDEAYEGENGLHKPGIEMARKTLERAEPAPLDIFQHGMCFGGTCETGGTLYKGAYGGVFRDRACSKCRYRVTGTRFVPGIINRVNCLAWELRAITKRSAKLANAIAQKEAEGCKVPHSLKTAADSERRLRENVFQEWVAECQTLSRLEALKGLLRGIGVEKHAALVGAGIIDEDKVSLGFADVHEFELVHTLFKDSMFLPATTVELPPDAELEWRRVLQMIYRANKLEEYMLQASDRAMVEAGDLLLDTFGEKSTFQRLVEASSRNVPFDDFARIKPQIAELLVTRHSIADQRHV